MKTRSAAKAEAEDAAAAASRSSCAAASKVAVTPSPSKKKRKAHHLGSYTAPSSSRSITFDSENDLRDEMRNLVLSRVIDLDSAPVVHSEKDIDFDTSTYGGWCLVDGLVHCATASNGILLPLIKKHGPPPIYLDYIRNNKRNLRSEDDCSTSDYEGSSSDDDESMSELNVINGCRSFRSLCQIVSGQHLDGSTAKIVWGRLLKVVDAKEEDVSNLTPERILSIVEDGDTEEVLRAFAGLSTAKCDSLTAIATSFRDGVLCDEFLLGDATNDEIRSRLLSIKGLGPSVVDMFLLFQCHRADVFPIDDPAFRNGTSHLWGVYGKAADWGLCRTRNEQVIRDLHRPFAPYRSISSYYMYNCCGKKR
mmetsp:Transcript_38754/g.83484  ORF Transcript_38754/g.83484 Transcript_38754/m.83484 type:complete len:364 (+) Transcript_38754:185-1276(+)